MVHKLLRNMLHMPTKVYGLFGQGIGNILLMTVKVNSTFGLQEMMGSLEDTRSNMVLKLVVVWTTSYVIPGTQRS